MMKPKMMVKPKRMGRNQSADGRNNRIVLSRSALSWIIAMLFSLLFALGGKTVAPLCALTDQEDFFFYGAGKRSALASVLESTELQVAIGVLQFPHGCHSASASSSLPLRCLSADCSGQPSKQTDRQTDRRTGGQTGRQTDARTNKFNRVEPVALLGQIRRGNNFLSSRRHQSQSRKPKAKTRSRCRHKPTHRSERSSNQISTA